MSYRFWKRFIDVVVAAGLLLLLALPLLLLAILLAVANRGKPFFTQKRPGLRERIFTLIKFKTMSDARDASGQLLPDAERLTFVGKWVRRSSLDELPQLINVLKGDMSLVGPRPLLVEYLPLYNKEQKRRHNVRPGITGWAQVNGRNAISWEEKFRLDVWYVAHLSFALDMRILWLTILKVFKREGISSATSATMEKFTGSAHG
jgi:lipopolysaccharide/colanic/teichoic acid biosynthesis glycosyltransferase